MTDASNRCVTDCENENTSFIEASFHSASSNQCKLCGTRSALRLFSSRTACSSSVRGNLVHHCDRSVEAPRAPSVLQKSPMASDHVDCHLTEDSIEAALAIEDGLPSYYEHLSVSLLVPESPEPPASPSSRRRVPRPQSPVLPLPDNMTPIGDFLNDVVAFVEVRSDLGDHSGSVAALLFRMGASIAASLNSSVTHAVLSNGRPANRRRAESLGVRIVAARWVMACVEEARKVEEDKWPIVDQITQEEQRRVRQYRYRNSTSNGTPSPVSVRNLSRLSKQRRREGSESVTSDSSVERIGCSISASNEDLIRSPRGTHKWTSPRKSLRRMLFKHPTTSRQRSDSSDDDGTCGVTMEIPETQTPMTQQENNVELWVSETDPFVYSSSRHPIRVRDIDDIEVPETQPEQETSIVSETPSDALKVRETSSDSLSVENTATVLEVLTSSTRERQLIRSELPEMSINELSDGIEASFEELHISAQKTIQQETVCKADTVNPERSYFEEYVKETADESPHQCQVEASAPRKPSHSELKVNAHESTFDMELTRPVFTQTEDSCQTNTGQISETEGSDMNLCHQEMIFTQPVRLSSSDVPIHSSDDASASNELPLMLKLPDGVSQSQNGDLRNEQSDTSGMDCCSSDVCSSSDRRMPAVSEEIGLITEEEIMGTKAVGSERGGNSREQVVVSSEGRRHSSQEEQATCSTNSDGIQRSHWEITEKTNNDVERKEDRSLMSSSHVPDGCSQPQTTEGNFSTPICFRKTKISGVFSDDESPCIDKRRTVVLTAVKNKAALIESLSRLANKRNIHRMIGDLDPLIVASEVTTRTEVVVVGRRKRTISVLLGIAWACWFVNVSWVEACVREKRWLNPALFEVRDFLPAMVSSRMMRNERRIAEGPLKDVAVFISRTRSLRPPIEALQRMVLQTGGKIVFDPRRADIYVGKNRPIKKLRCPCVNPSWIIGKCRQFVVPQISAE